MLSGTLPAFCDIKSNSPFEVIFNASRDAGSAVLLDPVDFMAANL